MILLTTLSLLVFASAGQAAMMIITPIGGGTCYGSGFYPLDRAFDSQPTWDSGLGEPVGGGTTGSDAPNFDDRYGWVDFGEDFADIRIYQTWTMYRSYTTEDQTPYVGGYWTTGNSENEDPGNHPYTPGVGNDPNAIAENQINFNTATGLDTGGTTPWIQDKVFTTPVIPQARYLVLHSDPVMDSRAKEYAFVGEIVPEPTSLGLLGVGALALLKRRR